MSGSSTCCAQPASSATRARRSPIGRRTARAAAARAGSALGQQLEHRPAAASAGTRAAAWRAGPRERRARKRRGYGQRRRAPSRAARLSIERALAVLLGVARGSGVSRSPYSTPDGQAVTHAWQPRQLSMKGERLLEVQRALEHLLHQEDAPARRVHLLAHRHVGRAGRQAEAAVHAAADRVRHRLALGAERRGVDVVLHQRTAATGVRARSAVPAAARRTRRRRSAPSSTGPGAAGEAARRSGPRSAGSRRVVLGRVRPGDPGDVRARDVAALGAVCSAGSSFAAARGRERDADGRGAGAAPRSARAAVAPQRRPRRRRRALARAGRAHALEPREPGVERRPPAAEAHEQRARAARGRARRRRARAPAARGERRAAVLRLDRERRPGRRAPGRP